MTSKKPKITPKCPECGANLEFNGLRRWACTNANCIVTYCKIESHPNFTNFMQIKEIVYTTITGE